MIRSQGLYKSYKDIVDTNISIGRLSNFKFSGKNTHGHVLLCCMCSCGNVAELTFSNINDKNNKIISCGCWHKEVVRELGYKNRKYTINHEKVVYNRHMDYIIGLLSADGCNTGKIVTIGLSEEDGYLLEQIKEYLGYTGPLYFKDRKLRKPSWKNSYILSISDRTFTNFVKKCGVVKNKTYDYKVPVQYLLNPDFWRGMIDGDGCIFKYRYQHKEGYTYSLKGLTLVGTLDTIEKFKEYTNSIVKINNKIRRCTYSNVYTITITGKNSIKILNEIYKNKENSFYMIRKYEKYLSLL